MRLLFVPVSAPQGTGEYARSLAIASAAATRWPEAEIHFVLNRHAPYAGDVPFPATLLPSSPTFHPTEVSSLIRDMRPDLVLFDNAGRTAQIRAAREIGARVVYVSSRPRQRRKAFRLRWMRVLDEHWIACPEFIAGALDPVERLKLRWFPHPRVRYLDTVIAHESPGDSAAAFSHIGVTPQQFVLVVPGGGTVHRGRGNGPEVMAAAAAGIASPHCAALVIGGPPRRIEPHVHHVPWIPMAQLASLMRRARLVLTNGGDTMLQALACEGVCVAAALAQDQAHRIARCSAQGLVTGERLDASALTNTARALLQDEARRNRQLERVKQCPIDNGLETALDAISRLLH